MPVWITLSRRFGLRLVMALGLGLLVWVLAYSVAPYPETRIRVTVMPGAAAEWQIYFPNRFGEWHELYSVKQAVPAATVPQELVFPIRRFAVPVFRLTIRNQHEFVRIKNVTLEYAGQLLVWDGPAVQKHAWINQADEVKLDPTGALQLRCTPGTYVDFHRELMQSLRFHKRGLKYIWLLAMLVAALAYCLPGKIQAVFGWLAEPKHAFLVLAIFTGMSLLLVTPPFKAPDEGRHLWRIFGWVEGQGLGHPVKNVYGTEIPAALIAAEKNCDQATGNLASDRTDLARQQAQWGVKMNPQQRNFIAFCGTVAYSPACYLPQIAAVGAGKLLALDPLPLLYLGRLANLTAWIALLYWVLTLLPAGRNLVLLVSLLPMSIYLAASLSADAMNNAYVFVLLALTLRGLTQGKVTNNHWRLIGGFAILLALGKIVYFPLVGMVFLLWQRQDRRQPEAKIFNHTLLIGLLALVAAVGWLQLTQPVMTNNNINVGSVVRAQKDFLLHHPLEFIRIMLATLRQFSWEYFRQAVAGLGFFRETSMPWPLHPVLLMALLGVGLMDGSPQLRISIRSKLWLTLILGAVFGLMMSALFIYCTPAGSPVVTEIQGRYFIPVLAIMGMMFYNNFLFVRDKSWLTLSCFGLLLPVHLHMLSILLFRYYGI